MQLLSDVGEIDINLIKATEDFLQEIGYVSLNYDISYAENNDLGIEIYSPYNNKIVFSRKYPSFLAEEIIFRNFKEDILSYKIDTNPKEAFYKVQSYFSTLTSEQKENLIIWAEELEKERFTQGTGQLYYEDVSKQQYCCLGVKLILEGARPNSFSYITVEGDSFFESLPGNHFLYRVEDYFVHMNDTAKFSFKQIARRIKTLVYSI